MNILLMPSVATSIQFTLALIRKQTTPEAVFLNDFKFYKTFKKIATDYTFSLNSTLDSVSTKAMIGYFGFEQILEDSTQIPTVEGLQLKTNTATHPKIGITTQFGSYTIVAFYVYFSLPCESSCATCSAVSEADCLTCSDNLPIDSASGLCKCSSRQYRAATTGTCTECTSPCETCSGTGTNC